MTDVTTDALGPPDKHLPTTKAVPGWWGKVETVLERISEHLNPILVKEARQALKSRLFAIAFTLLLALGWAWSLVGIALLTPAVYYAPGGPFMLFGYYIVLAAPLIVLVPFAAFRSMAWEREDGTFELLVVTTLTPNQIVGGKLGSAVLQMLVFLSALSPCIAFTYMLRGIDILTIAAMLLYLFLVSLILSVVCLLLATITREKHWQVVLSVAIVLGLAFLFFLALWTSGALLDENPVMPYDEPDFWIGHLGFLSGYATYFVLFYLAAAARITFASNNRSTRLRVVMLVQHLLLLGWLMYAWVRSGFEEEILMIYICFAAVHWYVMGILMTGESGTLSPRARRALPQSLAGRALLTWFNPGPGTGYVFAVSNLLVSTILVLQVVVTVDLFSPSSGFPDWEELIGVSLAVFCYVVIYLGVGRLILIAARWLIPAGIVLSVLIHIILVVAGTLVPLVMQFSLMGFDDNYTPLQISNPFWTLVELGEGNDAWDPAIPLGPVDIPIVLVLLGTAACIMLPVHLAIAAREVRSHVRVAPPPRVEEEEAELHPPPAAGPTSPWDSEPDNGSPSEGS